MLHSIVHMSHKAVSVRARLLSEPNRCRARVLGVLTAHVHVRKEYGFKHTERVRCVRFEGERHRQVDLAQQERCAATRK